MRLCYRATTQTTDGVTGFNIPTINPHGTDPQVNGVSHGGTNPKLPPV